MRFEYSFVLDKIRKVVYSCRTTEQLVNAGRYSVLLIMAHTRHEGGAIDIHGYFEQTEKRLELMKWVKTIVKKQKLAIS